MGGVHDNGSLVWGVGVLGHYILQQMEEHGRPHEHGSVVQHKRVIPARGKEMGPPTFSLKGLAIGNGLTDPASQVRLSWPTMYSSLDGLCRHCL